MPDSLSGKSVAVIGSGVGGLSVGIVLAKLGLKVTIVEKNREPGGMMRGYSRRGIDCPVGVHYMGALGADQILRRIFEYLGVQGKISVERMGKTGVIDRYIYDDFTFDLPEGIEAYRNALKKRFPDQSPAIDTIVDLIEQTAVRLNSLDFFLPGHFDVSIFELMRPMGEVTEELGCSSNLKSVLAVPSCWIGVPFDSCPMFYYLTTLASYLMSSWRLCSSGAEMVQAFVDRFVSLGGKLLTGEEVLSIQMQRRQIRGLRFKSGNELSADSVVACIHPLVLMKMIAADAVKPSYRQRIESMQNTHGIFAVHALLDSGEHPECDHNVFRIHTDDSGNIDDMKFYQIRKTERPDKSLLTIMSSGRENLWIPWEDTASGRRGVDYYELKSRQAGLLIREAETIFGTLKQMEVVDAFTPLTLRDWVNSPGGSAYGILRSCDQLLAVSLLNRTSINGLFLAGQNVMAPGVLGTILGTFNTIRLMVSPDEFRSVYNCIFK